MLIREDTIAAVATPVGEGGIAVIRISGPGALNVMRSVFRRPNGKDIKPRVFHYGFVLGTGGETVDEAMAVYLPAPHTYTREDVSEIQCHGGRVQARRVLAQVLGAGARAAERGEFTKRAFFNGRLDLSRAEAVMALVASGSETAARASLRQLEGGVSKAVRGWADELAGVMSLIEASNDFPEEIEEQASAQAVYEGAGRVRDGLKRACDPGNARIVREGLNVVLAGRPNTGKSSILNALLGAERAIVTDQPGTTRDILTEGVLLHGMKATLIDTAGQREADDPIEKIGVERARGAEKNADMVLLILDGSSPLTDGDRALLARADDRYVAVVNKEDLALRVAREELLGLPAFFVSAKTGEGLGDIRREIARRAGAPLMMEDLLTLERHLESAQSAMDAIARAMRSIQEGAPLDMAAVDLAHALASILEITGESASEMVIERVFANFCVGK